MQETVMVPVQLAAATVAAEPAGHYDAGRMREWTKEFESSQTIGVQPIAHGVQSDNPADPVNHCRERRFATAHPAGSRHRVRAKRDFDYSM